MVYQQSPSLTMSINLSKNLLGAILKKPAYQYARQVYTQVLALKKLGRPYLLGYWLEGICDHELEDLDALLGNMATSPRVTDKGDDLILVAIVAHCAEMGDLTATVETATINKLLRKLHVCVKAELKVRAGTACAQAVFCIHPDFPVELESIDLAWVKSGCFPYTPKI